MAMQNDDELFGLPKKKKAQNGFADADYQAEEGDPNAPVAGQGQAFEKNWAGGYDPIGAGNNNSMTQPAGAFTNQNTPTTPPPVPVGGTVTSPASPPVHASESSTYNPNAGAPKANQYGGSASLDPAVMRQQTIDFWKKRFGTMPTEAQISEVIKYASRPDKFSDNLVRVGVNPYWIERIGTGSESADPSLAGTDTILQNYTGALPESGFNADHGFGQTAIAPSQVMGTQDSAINQWITKLLSGPTPSELASQVETDPAVSAYKRVSERKFGKMRKQAAEDAALGGTIASGGFSGKLRGLAEDQAADVATYAGDRAREVLQDRRAEIMDALRLAVQMGQYDKSLALQRELAKINKTIADNQLKFNYTSLGVNANREAVLAGLNG